MHLEGVALRNVDLGILSLSKDSFLGQSSRVDSLYDPARAGVRVVEAVLAEVDRENDEDRGENQGCDETTDLAKRPVLRVSQTFDVIKGLADFVVYHVACCQC